MVDAIDVDYLRKNEGEPKKVESPIPDPDNLPEPIEWDNFPEPAEPKLPDNGSNIDDFRSSVMEPDYLEPMESERPEPITQGLHGPNINKENTSTKIKFTPGQVEDFAAGYIKEQIEENRENNFDRTAEWQKDLERMGSGKLPRGVIKIYAIVGATKELKKEAEKALNADLAEGNPDQPRTRAVDQKIEQVVDAVNIAYTAYPDKPNTQ